MKKFLIRDMLPGDYDIFAEFYADLHRIHFEAMPDTFRPQVSLPPRDVYEKDLQEPNRKFFMAEIDGKAAGMCDIVLKMIPDNPNYPLFPAKNVHINNLYVSPEFRRHGVATALYREAERWGKTMGAGKMTLMVWTFNEDALGLYRKLGMDVSFYQMEAKL